MNPIDLVLDRLKGPEHRLKGAGPGQWSARCPAHDDRVASLSIGTGEGGRALLKCWAKCRIEDIVAALNLKMSDLGPPRDEKMNGTSLPRTAKAWPNLDGAVAAVRAGIRGAVEAGTWTYHDEHGHETAAVARFDLPAEGEGKKPKSFRPFRKVAAGWQVGDPAGKWHLYRLVEALAAVNRGERVWVTEGEKCADTMATLGLVAVASAHGAGAAGKSDWGNLAKVAKEIVIIPDHDVAGESYAMDVENLIHAASPDTVVRVVHLSALVGPDFPHHGDICDFLDSFRDGQEAEAIAHELNTAADRAEPMAVEAATPNDEAVPPNDEFPPLEPINFLDLLAENPQRGPAVIDGVLREGAVGTLIGGSKTKKSWLVAWLIAAALTGGEWLGHPVAKCRVLVIDGELTRATMLFRVSKVLEALGIDPVAVGAGLDLFDLRGRTKDAPRALACARSKGQGHWGLMVLDPLYTMYPPDPRFSENDNAAMRRLFDGIITLAGDTGAAILAIHHLSKGSQAEKGLTDLGAGAGAIARAGDAHLALRPHRERDCVVFDGVVRDFPEVAPSCWRFNFPLYSPAPDLDPTDLAGKRPQRSATTKFMEGGKSKPEPMNATEFAKHFITDEPKELPFIQAMARSSGIKPKTVEQFLREAVAIGKVFKVAGRTGPGGTPAMYASAPILTPESAPESVESKRRGKK